MEFALPFNLFALSCISKAKSRNERKGMQVFKTVSPFPYADASRIAQSEIQDMIEKHLISLGVAAIYGPGEKMKTGIETMLGIVVQGEKEPTIDSFISGYIIPQTHFEYYKDNFFKVQIIPGDDEPGYYRISITTIARVVIDKKEMKNGR